jgi:hypothetical protein
MTNLRLEYVSSSLQFIVRRDYVRVICRFFEDFVAFILVVGGIFHFTVTTIGDLYLFLYLVILYQFISIVGREIHGHVLAGESLGFKTCPYSVCMLPSFFFI